MKWPWRPDKTARNFNFLAREIHYLADQWNFAADQRIQAALSTEKQSNSCTTNFWPDGSIIWISNITLAMSCPVWCEDNMAAIVIRNLSLETHRALQARAARHNRSTEAEARMILDEAVRPVARIKLGSALAALAQPFAGLDLDISRDKTPAKPITLR
jgi:antitoxin FitA